MIYHENSAKGLLTAGVWPKPLIPWKEENLVSCVISARAWFWPTSLPSHWLRWSVQISPSNCTLFGCHRLALRISSRFPTVPALFLFHSCPLLPLCYLRSISLSFTAQADLTVRPNVSSAVTYFHLASSTNDHLLDWHPRPLPSPDWSHRLDRTLPGPAGKVWGTLRRALSLHGLFHFLPILQNQYFYPPREPQNRLMAATGLPAKAEGVSLLENVGVLGCQRPRVSE